MYTSLTRMVIQFINYYIIISNQKIIPRFKSAGQNLVNTIKTETCPIDNSCVQLKNI